VITSAVPAPVVRRASRAAALVAAPVLALVTSPAFAESGDRWSDPDPVDPMHTLLWFVVAPIALFAVVVFLAIVPALIRREPLLPRHGKDDAQWIGGPAKDAKQLPAADDKAGAGSGGASGTF
jgi:hypothetical protein